MFGNAQFVIRTVPGRLWSTSDAYAYTSSGESFDETGCLQQACPQEIANDDGENVKPDQKSTPALVFWYLL